MESELYSMQAEHFIYAITDGRYVKLGYAKNISRRLKELQTGSAEVLRVAWQWPVCKWRKSTSIRVSAKNLEKHLHKSMREFHVRGEWFTPDCLPHLPGWAVEREALATARAERDAAA